MTLKWSSATDQLYAVSNSSPSLDLDFASNKSLLDNISGLPLVNHQRDASGGKSAGTYVGSDGLIKTSVVNLLAYSEDLTQWTTPTNVTLAISPSSPGSTNGWRVTSTSSVSFSRVWSPIYSGNGGSTVGSIYLRSDVPFTASLRIRYDSVQVAIKNVNVTTNWQRFTITATGSFTSAADFMIFLNSDGVSGASVTGRTLDVWGAQLQEGSTATTYVPTTSTASGAPRFDHDPVTGESLGLLIEEARTNFTYPSIIPSSTSGSFSVDGASVTENAGTAPDGTTTASLVEAAQGTGSNRVFSFVGGTLRDESYSWFIKASSPDAVFRVQLVAQLAPSGDITYTFSTGSVGGSFSGNVLIENYGNGWFRLSLTTEVFTTLTNSAYWQIIGFTGDFFIWGVQREAATFATSYIPTSGSAVTRAADAADITGANFSSWYSQSEGTVYSEFAWNLNNQSNYTFPWYIRYDGDNSNGVYLGNWGSTTQQSLGVRFNSPGVTSQLPIPGSTPGVSHKYATTLNAFDFAVALDGGFTGTYTGADLATSMNSIQIGNLTGSYQINGHISRLTYYPYRLSDTILQEITS